MVNLVELVWVLGSCYDASHATITATLDGLLRTRSLVLESSETVARALRLFGAGHKDFADCLIACSATAAGCSLVFSFDKAAIRQAGMAALP